MLKHLTQPFEEIKVGSGSFNVHGLCLEELSMLVRDFREEVTKLVENDFGDFDVFITEAPKFCATMISLAAHEPDQFEVALKLPIGVQVDALTKIWRLTGVTEDMLGKGLAGALEYLQRLASSVGKPTSAELQRI